MVTIKVIDKPITPIFGPVTPVSQGTTLPKPTASGSWCYYYPGTMASPPDSGTPNVLGTGNTLPGTAYGSATNINTPGNYTIWAKESLGTTCSHGFVVVTVKPTPTAPVAPSVTICETNPLPNLTASGGAGTFNWYGDASLNKPSWYRNYAYRGIKYSSIANNNVAGTYSVYVTETLNGCTGIATQVNIVSKRNTRCPCCSECNRLSK